MKKITLSFITSLTVMVLGLSFAASANAQIVCPAGYTCTPTVQIATSTIATSTVATSTIATSTINLGVQTIGLDTASQSYKVNLSFIARPSNVRVASWSLYFSCPSNIDVSTVPGASCSSPFQMSTSQNNGNVYDKAFWFKNNTNTPQTVSAVLFGFDAYNNMIDFSGTTTITVPPTGAGPMSWSQVTVQYPNGGQVFNAGQQVTVKWSTNRGTFNLASTSDVQILLSSNRVAVVNLEHLTNDGTETITLPTNMVSGNNFKISVTVRSDSPFGYQQDESDMPFSITASSSPAQCYTFVTNLGLNSNGVAVIALQSWLMAKGFSIPALTTGQATIGYYGPETAAAVSLFQASVGIGSTGFVGPLTRTALNASCVKNNVDTTQPYVSKTYIQLGAPISGNNMVVAYPFSVGFILTAGNDPVFLGTVPSSTNSLVVGMKGNSASIPSIISLISNPQYVPGDSAKYFYLSPSSNRSFVYSGTLFASGVVAGVSSMQVLGIQYGTSSNALHARTITSGLENLKISVVFDNGGNIYTATSSATTTQYQIKPTIFRFSQYSGTPGTKVVIYGQNFCTNTSNSNFVTFNNATHDTGDPKPIISADGKYVTFTVPNVTPGIYDVYVESVANSTCAPSNRVSFTVNLTANPTNVPTPSASPIYSTTPVQVVCPAGYICNVNSSTSYCPSGYVCSATTYNCPSGYTCTTYKPASIPSPTPAPTYSPVYSPIYATTTTINSNQTRINAVTQLYVTLLKHQPDQQGLNYWVNSGLSIDQIRSSIMNTQEYINLNKASPTPTPSVNPVSMGSSATEEQATASIWDSIRKYFNGR